MKQDRCSLGYLPSAMTPMPSVLSVRRCLMAWYSGDSYQAWAAAGVAVDDDDLGVVGLQDGSDGRDVLLVFGLVRDRVVRDEIPGHDASALDSSGRASTCRLPSYCRVRRASHAGG